MAQATKTHESPNGQAAVRTGPVAERAARLRELSATDPDRARDEAWDWIGGLGRRAADDRDGAIAELNELFLCGRPADEVDGQTDGILVTSTVNPIADRVIGSITSAWMPWVGKKFDSHRHRGINTLTRSARWPSKLLWPMYKMREDPLGEGAFEFTTYVEAGRLDPSIDVLVIDYESVPENPRLFIRQVRDELVEIVPGANLGKMLVKLPRRERLFPALFFALRA